MCKEHACSQPFGTASTVNTPDEYLGVGELFYAGQFCSTECQVLAYTPPAEREPLRNR